MFDRLSRSCRALLCSLALATVASGAELRVLAEQSSASPTGSREVVVWVEAGHEHAGSAFAAVPFVNGRPQRTLARCYDRLSGVLNQRGRARLVLQLPRLEDLSADELGALGGGLEHRVAVFDRRGRVVQATTGGSLNATASVAVGGLGVNASSQGPRSQGSLQSPLLVTVPSDGARVGSPSIDVRGRLFGLLNHGATQVRVNGQLAEVFPSPNGSGSFLLANFELATGLNELRVEAVGPGGAITRQSLDVDLERATSFNVQIANGRAYAARGPLGYAVMDLATREFETFVGPTGRVDDLSLADGLLFLLDAQGGANLSVMSLADPDQPMLVSGPVGVPTNLFSGVSAGGNRVVVSGGTAQLTVRSYAPDGTLGAAVGSIDLGLGQPDVLIAQDGSRAFVSTDFIGSVNGAAFGISTIALNAPPSSPTLLSRTGLSGAGFTGGVTGPANFPIESALVNGQLITAHGGGLSRIAAGGALLETTPLGFDGVNVDAVGDRVFVVGTGRSLAEFDLAGGAGPALVETRTFAGPGGFTGVGADGGYVAIASPLGGLRVLRR